ncbi:glycosyltransferase [Niabella drilacis]|uniref:Glycosyltransferase involved in cell wall bisynthesis n=1 Tax=Niabella drilacis (strain DSM 25811 / CCM 8410 / CCUG 62505 / LMG 26954 / E90) TaxID=1285928 RepID=A0A1G6W4P2_NIADE|nr:glycosyltransferase [Niabella drilacis]SDD60842.1 Glycosyltransferase involved in cell wall bisynthesis [Niabella drilacis]
MKQKRVFFTVTNDLSFDQRMNRICSTLAANGWQVTLVGRKLKGSSALPAKPFRQKRLRCFFSKGKLFYAEYNIRLFFWLLFHKVPVICAIDLDTILPCLFVSRLHGSKRVYDAHEFFTELKEVKTNPLSFKIWTAIEKFAVPGFRYGYTVCDSIAREFEKRYQVSYKTIRNIAASQLQESTPGLPEYIIYAGAVNEGRGFEALIPAMKQVRHPLHIYGDGNFMPQLVQLIKENNVEEKVILKGMTPPDALRDAIRQAKVAVGLIEATGMNQYWALPNKLFDYIQAEIPQLTMNYPEIKKINDQYHIAVLIDALSPAVISGQLNLLMEDVVLYQTLQLNCRSAKKDLNWEREQYKVLDFYNSLV